MSETKKVIRDKQTANDGVFDLVALLDELNNRYKVVNMPTKEDVEREQSHEAN